MICIYIYMYIYTYDDDADDDDDDGDDDVNGQVMIKDRLHRLCCSSLLKIHSGILPYLKLQKHLPKCKCAIKKIRIKAMVAFNQINMGYNV